MIHFLSGLPRSGSTLLGALLSQHENLHTCPTNSLIDLVIQARNSWIKMDGFQAQGLINIKYKIRNALKGMMQGFHIEYLSKGCHVLDKNRAWMGYIGLIEDILERPIKILCPIRDLKEIFASFEKLRNTNQLTIPCVDNVREQSILGRAQILFAEDGTIGASIRKLCEAIDSKYQSRLLFINYDDLLNNTQTVCTTAFIFLGLKPKHVDTLNVIGPINVRDVDVWGLPLHKIRPEVSSNTSNWQEVIPPYVGDWIDSEFPQIQRLIQWQQKNLQTTQDQH